MASFLYFELRLYRKYENSYSSGYHALFRKTRTSVCPFERTQRRDRFDDFCHLLYFQEIEKNFHPVLRYFFLEKFKRAENWFHKRLNYTRSTAVASIGIFAWSFQRIRFSYLPSVFMNSLLCIVEALTIILFLTHHLFSLYFFSGLYFGTWRPPLSKHFDRL